MAGPVVLDAGRKRRFQKSLLGWYQEKGRDLPWRKTDNPYHILVSEVMLQQTPVERVLPKYKEWLEKYPSFKILAKAPLADVKKEWYPLGYNIRPVRLHRIAKEVTDNLGGRLPSCEEDLLKLKGIGRYTAGAILSFAYREEAPILDTNVKRVLERVFLWKREAKPSQFWVLAEALLPGKGKTYDFNQALMDFGALQCTARKPKCSTCPMKKTCIFYRSLPRLGEG